MDSITVNEINFKDLERNFFEIGCEVARMLMKKYLEKKDNELKENRNKAELRHKGLKNTTIKTLMGEIPFKRAIYKRIKEDGEIEHIYLLDEALGFDTIGIISPNLVEKISEQICEMSYRDVATTISECTNQSFSHQGVWNIVQIIGKKQAETEDILIKAYKNNELCGEKEVPILFEEADGLWLSMQGKDRKNSSNGKKELKVGIIYEGWEKRHPSSKEYKTVEKKAFAGYMGAGEFKLLKDAMIAKEYRVDEINYRILNGDGASWIKQGHDTEGDIFQLDPYHLSKCVVRNIVDKKARKSILECLKAGEFKKVFDTINTLKYECGGLEETVKKLTTLESYIKSNIDGIVIYSKREGLDLPNPPTGIEYKTLGTMESNINIYSVRMKKGKCWTKNGATNLSKIISLKISKSFKDKITSLVSGKISEKVTERFDEVISSAKMRVKEGIQKVIYPLHRGEIPFANSKNTNGTKAIRNMFNLKPFSEIIYR